MIITIFDLWIRCVWHGSTLPRIIKGFAYAKASMSRGLAFRACRAWTLTSFSTPHFPFPTIVLSQASSLGNTIAAHGVGQRRTTTYHIVTRPTPGGTPLGPVRAHIFHIRSIASFFSAQLPRTTAQQQLGISSHSFPFLIILLTASTFCEISSLVHACWPECHAQRLSAPPQPRHLPIRQPPRVLTSPWTDYLQSSPTWSSFTLSIQKLPTSVYYVGMWLNLVSNISYLRSTSDFRRRATTVFPLLRNILSLVITFERSVVR